jgi:hypothetical protein
MIFLLLFLKGLIDFRKIFFRKPCQEKNKKIIYLDFKKTSKNLTILVIFW